MVADVAVQPWKDNIPNSQWLKFNGSSHLAHWEQREEYMKVVGDFLLK